MKDILRAIKYWILRKLDPNERVDCENCEYLKMQVSIEKQEKQQLLDQLFHKNEEVNKQEIEYKPIHTTKHVPWRVKQRELEDNDRKRAADIKQNSSVMAKPDTGINGTDVQSIEELETEMGIPTTGSEVKSN